jgi:alcohol dehydrogenase class IV
MGFGGGSALDAAKAIVWFSQQFGIKSKPAWQYHHQRHRLGSDQRLRD